MPLTSCMGKIHSSTAYQYQLSHQFRLTLHHLTPSHRPKVLKLGLCLGMNLHQITHIPLWMQTLPRNLTWRRSVPSSAFPGCLLEALPPSWDPGVEQNAVVAHHTSTACARVKVVYIHTLCDDGFEHDDILAAKKAVVPIPLLRRSCNLR